MPAQRIALDLAIVEQNLETLQAQLAQRAAARGFPSPRVVVVSKYLTADDAIRLRAAGVAPLGENRVNDLVDKVALPAKGSYDSLTAHNDDGWHFIGHLQRNKIAKVLPRISLLHSLDSTRLATAIDSWAEQQQVTVPCLVQVNVSGETQKGGLEWDVAYDQIIDWAGRYRQIELRGLMTMAPHQDAESSRPIFARLRELRERLAHAFDTSNPQHSFHELSMGMSNDAEVAAEEGATWIRVGSRLYTAAE